MSKLGRKVLIALGSNENSDWGDARETVQKAMQCIGDLAEGNVQISGLFSNPAFPLGSGPDFVNAAMAFSSSLPAADLLLALHEIEASAGRQRARRWGPRTLDLDLIAVADQVLPDRQTYQYWHDRSLQDQQEQAPERLILPHPRLQDRAFVLVPLRDVAPDWCHPVLRRTITELCAVLPAAARDGVVRMTEADHL